MTDGESNLTMAFQESIRAYDAIGLMHKLAAAAAGVLGASTPRDGTGRRLGADQLEEPWSSLVRLVLALDEPLREAENALHSAMERIVMEEPMLTAGLIEHMRDQLGGRSD